MSVSYLPNKNGDFVRAASDLSHDLDNHIDLRKTLYGFRLNPDTGHLDIEVINDGSPIVFPQDDIIDKFDYKQWVWTLRTLTFQWADGHLQMGIA